jgi:hypothetical protein
MTGKEICEEIIRDKMQNARHLVRGSGAELFGRVG